MAEQNKKPTSLGNISQDLSLVRQPENTTRFVLNGVNESNQGDLGVLSTEEGNAISHAFPEDFIPLGSVSINNNSSAVFLGNGVDSLIITVKKNLEIQIYFDDREDTNKLGFKLGKKIDAIYRLRRGCESTLYWVDPKPRKFILERPDKFKNSEGEWNIPSFDLIRKINKIPEFQNFEVFNSGGSLPPGSYLFSVQYLDSDFNPTAFVDSAGPIRIYQDSKNSIFRKIRGSSTKEEAFYQPESTSKSIRILLQNLDTENYPFYRIAIGEVNTGSGLVSEVKYSNEIPTSINYFTYTGTNFAQIGTQEEVSLFNLVIEEADHIEQLENILLLSSTRGQDTALCELQKYASKIQVDLEIKKVNLSLPIGANAKNPLAYFKGLGYMPGEIYSLGIGFILEGNIFTPMYHIPGKAASVGEDFSFIAEDNIYPMSIDNQCEDAVYTDNNTCDDTYSIWGLDSQGDALINTPIRHHRFPYRAKVGLPLYTKLEQDTATTETSQLKIEISGDLQLPECDPDDPDCVGLTLEDVSDIYYEITYIKLDENLVEFGDNVVYIQNIDYSLWDGDALGDGLPAITLYTPAEVAEGLKVISVREVETQPNGSVIDETYTFQSGENSVTSDSGANLTYTATSIKAEFIVEGDLYEANIFGLRFSNINFPEEIGGKKIIGHYFGRNIRTEEERTIVDTAVVGQSTKFRDYISHGHLSPEFDPGDFSKIEDKYFYFINPQFKFKDVTYDTFDNVVQEGLYNVTERLKSRVIIKDVVDGTTFEGSRHRDSERDKDGWQLHVRTRQNKVDYNVGSGNVLFNGDDIESVFYLSALESRKIDSTEGNPREYFNLSSDNKIGVLQLKESYTENLNNKFMYVSLGKKNSNPYANFRSTSYIKISPINYNTEDTEETVFGGDTYLSPISYTTSLFYRQQARKRRTKSGLLRAIAGFLTAAVGIFLIATGIGAAAGAALIGVGLTLAASGLEQEAFNRAYGRLYDEGLRDTVEDNFTFLFNPDEYNPVDDEIQWFGESTTFFFESSINMSLRHGVNKGSDPDFIDAPALSESGNESQANNIVESVTTLDRHMVEKLTFLDLEREESNRSYIGFALPEVYLVNKDYEIENILKYYEHLPIEYDCCSDCLEDFPHRTHYSLQSFEEELTDNYSVFLPNNYKDLQGETGKITDTFKIQNNLYILTKHALWHLPQNYQERVTDSIVSFIGTGEYFATPPRKIVDDDRDSAGTSFKWGVAKTRNGVLIISENENRIYFFNGNNLVPISNEGLTAYFRNNLKLNSQIQYNALTGENYPFIDQLSTEFGTGFISVYDTTKERLIITKKDFLIKNYPEDFRLCYGASGLIIFENYNQTIEDKIEEGFTYLGIIDCKMVFVKYEEVESNQTIYEAIESPEVSGLSSTNTASQSYDKVDWAASAGPNANQFNLAQDSFVTPGGDLEFIISIPINTPSSLVPVYRYNIHQTTQSNIIYTGDWISASSTISQNVVLTDIPGGVSLWISVEKQGGEFTSEETLGIRTWNWLKDVSGSSTTVNTITTIEEIREEITGIGFIPEIENHSFTISYSLKSKGWVSWHTYFPNFYLPETERFYSWIFNQNNLWEHNITGLYRNYYGKKAPFIVEFVSNTGMIATKIWDSILYQAEAKVYDETSNTFIDVNDVSFNKALLYNSYQISGEKTLVFKTDNNSDYMIQQISDNADDIILDRNERDFTINNFRDYRKDLTSPMFLTRPVDLQSDYYIDKVVNENNIDLIKDWTELESFRDKYLVVRLIFDTFDNTKLTMFFSMEDIKPSEK